MYTGAHAPKHTRECLLCSGPCLGAVQAYESVIPDWKWLEPCAGSKVRLRPAGLRSCGGAFSPLPLPRPPAEEASQQGTPRQGTRGDPSRKQKIFSQAKSTLLFVLVA